MIGFKPRTSMMMRIPTMVNWHGGPLEFLIEEL